MFSQLSGLSIDYLRESVTQFCVVSDVIKEYYFNKCKIYFSVINLLYICIVLGELISKVIFSGSLSYKL